MIVLKKRVCCFVVLLLVFILALGVSAEDDRVRVEAEDFLPEVSNPAVADDENMSGGKFIGIDSVGGHVIIYDNIPASKAFVVNYKAIHEGTILHVFIEKDSEFESLIDVDITPTGEDWGAPFLDTDEIEVDIPEGSKLKFTCTGSISIDYFEFILADEDQGEEPTIPSTGDLAIIQYAVFGVFSTLLLKKRVRTI